MNQSKLHQIILYITLLVASVALIVGIVGLMRFNGLKGATPSPTSNSTGTSQQMPSPDANIKTVTPSGGDGTSGTVSQ